MEKIIGLIDAPFTPFYQDGTVNFEPIPDYADLRHNLSGLFDHLKHLVPKRNLKALYRNAGQRMHLVKIVALVECRVDYSAAVLLDGHDHTAAVEVIDKSAVAYAQIRRHDICRAAFCKGRPVFAGAYR